MIRKSICLVSIFQKQNYVQLQKQIFIFCKTFSNHQSISFISQLIQQILQYFQSNSLLISLFALSICFNFNAIQQCSLNYQTIKCVLSIYIDLASNTILIYSLNHFVQIKNYSDYLELHSPLPMKQISVKQAEKWLEKLKNQDLQAYKDITKFLRKYQKTEDEYDCFIKINHTLLSHSKLADELNFFMDEGNKMVVNKPQEEKIKDLMTFVKKTRPDMFTKIISVIQQMSSKPDLNQEEMNSKLKILIKDIIKNDEELIKITEEALQLTGEQLINRLDLQHLKINRVPNLMVDEFDEELSKQKNQKPIKKEPPKVIFQKESVPEQKPQKAIPFSSITTIQDEKFIFKHLQKILDPKVYNNLIKIIRLFYLNIITKNEAFQLVNALELEEEVEFLKEIIETRQTDRRRLSLFRPLNDLDFSTCERPSPSYVAMPNSYPHRCKGKTEFLKRILNDVYVSVPHGTEQNFNVRFKNSNELNLLKSEDQRYEFDLYMMRLNKCYRMLEKILTKNESSSSKNQGSSSAIHNELSDSKVDEYIEKIISMGVIQLIYKNCSKQQKQELQWHLKTSQEETLQILKDRVLFQIKEMQSIKSIHAIRAWHEVALKNFSKALDLKGFEFKKNEKQKIKNTYFVTELHERANSLINGAEARHHLLVPFDERKEFFEVLNSFEASSRTQRCHNRELPPVKYYDLHNEEQRKYYPLMIMAFENKGITSKVYSLIHFYIDSYPMGDSEKIRCKLFLENFLIHYLGWQVPVKRFLNENFEEEKLHLEINNSLEERIDFTTWITETKEQTISGSDIQEPLSTLKTLADQSSPYAYLPPKSSSNSVLYGSEQLYSLLRFIYTLYERIIKMEQVVQYQEKIILFQLLFYSCIKAKEGVKFQENLNLIFGKHAYIFTTIYKLCDNLIRSLSGVSTCLLTAESLRLCKLESEEIYLLMLNKFCLANQLSNNKLIRFTYEKDTSLIYINLLESFYKTDDNLKDLIKKRQQICRSIDIYAMDIFDSDVTENKKKRKSTEAILNNSQQYIFEGSTIKMLNHKPKQDLLCFVGKCGSFAKNLKKELKRVSKINDILN